MSIESLYTNFYNYIANITTKKDLCNFKSNPNVTAILEHMTFDFGRQYLELILRKTPIPPETIKKYCDQNDLYGGGIKFDYFVDESLPVMKTSSSNFRYLFHAHLIMSYIGEKAGVQNIVEVGAGYGGLYLALAALAPLYKVKIANYHMVDLPAISELQQQYLKPFVKGDSKLHFHNAFLFGGDIENENLFLISNYCFSEISSENQKKYVDILFPKVKHGFMAWNFIPLYYFGFNTTQEEEYPKTGHYNKYVYF